MNFATRSGNTRLVKGFMLGLGLSFGFLFKLAVHICKTVSNDIKQ